MADRAGRSLLRERKAQCEGPRLPQGRRLGNTLAQGLSLSCRGGGAGWQRGGEKWGEGEREGRQAETRTQADREKQEGPEIRHTTHTDKYREQW